MHKRLISKYCSVVASRMDSEVFIACMLLNFFLKQELKAIEIYLQIILVHASSVTGTVYKQTAFYQLYYLPGFAQSEVVCVLCFEFFLLFSTVAISSLSFVKLKLFGFLALRLVCVLVTSFIFYLQPRSESCSMIQFG